ncbi:MAG TPA: type II secretion system F family protein [Candidatus Eisenbacteria bacterium]|jgi:type IV pilus assembly protein PilC|nr:type II secretion system F family protein [Candidatus Eisenbacteria bacterium]
MKYDEFAFVNQQLADMLTSDIPLEGALRQLSATMRQGKLRSELSLLEADLSKGVSLADALKPRHLPEFYLRMIQVGVQSNDLPGMLTMLANYYERLNSIWARLKGLMVYPLIVLFASLGLSVLIAFIFSSMFEELNAGMKNNYYSPSLPSPISVMIRTWTPTILLALVLGTVIVAWLLRPCRRWLRWRLPGFKEASLSNLASSCGVMLKGGADLNSSLNLVRELEQGTPAGRELALWQKRLADGHQEISSVTAQAKAFPGLFVWLISSSKGDLVSGFMRAAEIYYNRAIYRIDMLLYAALPVAVLVLGLMIVGQVLPLMRLLIGYMDVLGQVDVPPPSPGD